LDKQAAERAEKFRAVGMSYAMLHATKPSTAGFSVGSSPTSLLAWIGEKMIDWSDPETKPSLDTILTNVSIYWFTGTYPTSLWPYRSVGIPGTPNGKPKAVSWFPREIITLPRAVIKEDPGVTHFYAHEKGGHFAALEVPELLWADLEDFVAKVWKK
ncbi:Alpha/Beta hydrolase protein, partial [Macrophomina phaseolina]